MMIYGFLELMILHSSGYTSWIHLFALFCWVPRDKLTWRTQHTARFSPLLLVMLLVIFQVGKIISPIEVWGSMSLSHLLFFSFLFFCKVLQDFLFCWYGFRQLFSSKLFIIRFWPCHVRNYWPKKQVLHPSFSKKKLFQRSNWRER